jgi:hypothetical protein
MLREAAGASRKEQKSRVAWPFAGVSGSGFRVRHMVCDKNIINNIINNRKIRVFLAYESGSVGL